MYVCAYVRGDSAETTALDTLITNKHFDQTHLFSTYQDHSTSSPLQPHDSFTYDSIFTTNYHASPTTFEDEDPVSTSGSQPTIIYQSNSAMEEDLDDSADTTTPDALNTDRKLQKKLRQYAKQKEKRKIARLQNPRLNTHDKDEMS